MWSLIAIRIYSAEDNNVRYEEEGMYANTEPLRILSKETLQKIEKLPMFTSASMLRVSYSDKSLKLGANNIQINNVKKFVQSAFQKNKNLQHLELGGKKFTQDLSYLTKMANILQFKALKKLVIYTVLSDDSLLRLCCKFLLLPYYFFFPFLYIYIIYFNHLF